MFLTGGLRILKDIVFDVPIAHVPIKVSVKVGADTVNVKRVLSSEIEVIVSVCDGKIMPILSPETNYTGVLISIL